MVGQRQGDDGAKLAQAVSALAPLLSVALPRREDDAHAQDVMVCIQTGKSIQDTNRMKFQGTDFYVKSHDEMFRVFKAGVRNCQCG